MKSKGFDRLSAPMYEETKVFGNKTNSTNNIDRPS